MSRNCPQNNTVKGNGSNKPPGLPSYSMDMTLLEDEPDKNDVLESMPVGVMGIERARTSVSEPDESWHKQYLMWQHDKTQAPDIIGDCYAMTAEYLLTIAQPYPGDELNRK